MCYLKFIDQTVDHLISFFTFVKMNSLLHIKYLDMFVSTAEAEIAINDFLF